MNLSDSPQTNDSPAPLIHGFTGVVNPNKPSRFKVLLVDQDSNTINALRKVFSLEPYDLLYTVNAREAISMAKRDKPAVILCSLELFEMSGVDLLQAVGEMAPHTCRVLMFNDASASTLTDAINLGRVDYLIQKPWQDDALRQTISDLTQRFQKRVEDEQRQQLQADHVYCLEQLQEELQQKVSERIEDIRQVNALLDQSRKEIKLQYLSAIRVFCNFMELRSPALAAHSRRVADLSRIIAQHMNLEEYEIQSVYIAGLLHDIGKIGLPDRTLFTPFASLDGEAQSALLRHPIRAQTVFMNLPDMAEISTLIRHHHERFDGQGFPDGLQADAIPLGSRIIAVAEDFDELQEGWLAQQQLNSKDAQQFIQAAAGRRYDPSVVRVLAKALAEFASVPMAHETLVTAKNLSVGAVLARDFVGPDGYPWGRKDDVVDSRMLHKFRDGERVIGHPLKIYILKPRALKIQN